MLSILPTRLKEVFDKSDIIYLKIDLEQLSRNPAVIELLQENPDK